MNYVNQLLLVIMSLIFLLACSSDEDLISDTCIEKAWYRDADQDGFGDKNDQQDACVKPAGYVDNDKDCNDVLASVNPGAIEKHNGIDDNCNHIVDECLSDEDCNGVCIDGTCTIVGDSSSRDFTKYEFEHALTGKMIPYHLYEPDQSIDSSEKFPLIVALHGAEFFSVEQEYFLFDEVIGYYALAWIEEKNQSEYPAYVLAPHLDINISLEDEYRIWSATGSLDFIENLIDYVVQSNHIDPNRIYLTGHSMGGAGTWIVGSKLNTKFAALVPLSTALGSGSPGFEGLEKSVQEGDFTNLPVWSFIHKRDANSTSFDEHACRALFQSFVDKGYDPMITHWFGETHLDKTPSEIDEAILAGKIHLYTEYDYDCIYGCLDQNCSQNCHYAKTRALREALLFKWLFRQRKNE